MAQTMIMGIFNDTKKLILENLTIYFFNENYRDDYSKISGTQHFTVKRHTFQKAAFPENPTALTLFV